MKKLIILALIILIGCHKEVPLPEIYPETEWYQEQTIEHGTLNDPVPEYDWYVDQFLTNQCDTFYGEPTMYAIGLNWPDATWTTLGIFSWQSENYLICQDYVDVSATDVNVYLHDGPGKIDTLVWSSSSPDLIVDTISRAELYPGQFYDDLEPTVIRFRSLRDTVKVRIEAIGVDRYDIQ